MDDGHPPHTDDLPEDDVLGPDLRQGPVERELGDFTTTTQVLWLLPAAVVIGILASLVALVLLDLIAVITNLAYYQRISITLTSPALNTLGAVAIVIPMVGGLIVGLMARFGSERIRGHGIPEAMETILVGGSKVEPRLTILKPISSAISIGTGGPFGAEGPIILTGGALGSVLAQFFHLSAIERRTLLVAGAAAGMSAVFGTPVAAVALAVELLLFEWKPRSLVVVATASVVAAAIRVAFAQHGWIPPAPLFPVPNASLDGFAPLLGALGLGVACGGAAWVLTRAVYGAEDAFGLLPIHWSWWPVLGGLVVGIGGLLQPRALGVGYDTIGATLAGKLAMATLASVLIVKLVIWAVALGSGTSGGILAPILMMGAALGGLASPILPGGTESTWAVLGMAAVMAGVMRSPLTAVIFAIELTHDVNLLLPLLLVAVTAHLVSVLTLPRSILTEKVARRGFHVVREYAVEPLEALFVRDVMATDVAGAGTGSSVAHVFASFEPSIWRDRDRSLPVVAPDGRLTGVLRWGDLLDALARGEPERNIETLLDGRGPVAYPDETLRIAADRIVAHRVHALPVVERGEPDLLVGFLVETDLLQARERRLLEERHRERVLRLRR
ncbi:MAG TPA: chloride channel protein [Actinomycetota bacterium]|nr:chloride channel protein [Actinomycetota bacterium]